MRIFNALKESAENGKATLALTNEITKIVGEMTNKPQFIGYKQYIKNTMIHEAVVYIRRHAMIRAELFANNRHVIGYCKTLCEISFVNTLKKFKGQNNENKTSDSLEKRPQDEKGEDGSARCSRVNEGYPGRWVLRGL